MIQKIDDVPPIRVKDDLVLVLIRNKWCWAKMTGQSNGNYYYDILGWRGDIINIDYRKVAEIINARLSAEEIVDSMKAVEKYNEALMIVRRRKNESESLSKV